MGQILRFIMLVILIALVSTGVYFYLEERNMDVDKAKEKVGETLEKLKDRTKDALDKPERERPAPENPPRY